MLVSGPEVAMVAIVFGTVSGTIISVAKTFANRSQAHEPRHIASGSESTP